MPLTPQLFFASFRLDPINACLWNGTRIVTLRPKTFRVLQYLLEHAGQLVTKEELLEAVWSETNVGDAVLKVCIGELRKLLDETIHEPQFITTVHRRGYRFIGKVKRLENGVAEHASVIPPAVAVPQLPPVPLVFPTIKPIREAGAYAGLATLRAPLVEREVELQMLHERLQQALQGQRQAVFVTGEAGIGKSAVVEAFAMQATAACTLRIARGQCYEPYGTGEAYQPVIDALGQLCRQADGDLLTALLRHQAPTWLAQIPGLLPAADRAALAEDVCHATRERMLREIAAALDILAAERLLLLIFEDLHWSDYATLELISFLVRRRAPARLMILGTYRPAEVLVREHPLWIITQDLQRHSDSKDIPLALLSPLAVTAYLEARFPEHQFPDTLASWLYEHTDGHPLFVVTMVQSLVQRGVLQRQDGQWIMNAHDDSAMLETPLSLWQMLERQFSRLPEKAQRVIETASVVGVEFAAALVATCLDISVDDVEAQCEELVRQQWLRSAGVLTWPDGTTSTCYSFTHTLYQQAAYKRIGEVRRIRVHQRLGQRLAGAYGTQAHDIATELAAHYERGQDVQQAMQYWQQAAETAAARHAYREVRSTLTRALRLLETCPATLERDRHELAILIALGPALMDTPGQAVAEVERVYRRTVTLCQQVGDLQQAFHVLLGLQQFYEARGAADKATEVGEQLLTLAHTLHEPLLLMEAHATLGSALFCLGEFAAARSHLEQGLAVQGAVLLPAIAYERDPEITCHTSLAALLWVLGYPEQARQHGCTALQLARTRMHPQSLVVALLTLAGLHQVCGDVETTQTLADEALALVQTHDLPQWAGMGAILRGWTAVMQGQTEAGMAQIAQGVTAYEGTTNILEQEWALTLLAETSRYTGQSHEGLKVVAQALALVASTDVRCYAAELHRLKSALLIAHKPHSTHRAPSKPWLFAEESAQQALALARAQGAKGWELRSAMTLGRLWQQQGKSDDARQLLEPIYAWFSEGVDTLDLQQAKAFLAELA